MRTKAQLITALSKELAALVAEDKAWQEEFSDLPFNGTEENGYFAMVHSFHDDIYNLLFEINPAFAQSFAGGFIDGDASADDKAEFMLNGLNERHGDAE